MKTTLFITLTYSVFALIILAAANPDIQRQAAQNIEPQIILTSNDN